MTTYVKNRPKNCPDNLWKVYKDCLEHSHTLAIGSPEYGYAQYKCGVLSETILKLAASNQTVQNTKQDDYVCNVREEYRTFQRNNRKPKRSYVGLSLAGFAFLLNLIPAVVPPFTLINWLNVLACINISFIIRNIWKNYL